MSGNTIPAKTFEQAVEWFARLRADDVSVRDHRRFRAWLIQDPDAPAAFLQVLQLWDRTAVLGRPEKGEGLVFQGPRRGGSLLKLLAQ